MTAGLLSSWGYGNRKVKQRKEMYEEIESSELLEALVA
jgi:hypothetical protein